MKKNTRWKMKDKMRRGLVLAAVVIGGLFAGLAEAASFNDAASGNWNAGATWGNAGSTVGVDYPGAGDTVTINSHTVTLAADAACADITIAAGGTLTASSYTITCSGNWDDSGGTFNYDTGTVDLTGSGSVTTDSDNVRDFYNLNMAAATKTTTLPSWNRICVDNVLTLGTGTLTNAGGADIFLYKSSGTPLVNNGATITLASLQYKPGVAGETITVAGGTYNMGPGGENIYFSPTANNITFNLSADLTISGATNYTYIKGTGTILNTNGYALSGPQLFLSGAVTINFGSSAIDLGTGASSHSIYNNSGAATLNLGSATINCEGHWAASGTGGTMTVNPGTSTVVFDGTGTQNITSNSQSFYNLTINKASGSAVLQDALNVDGNFRLQSGTFNANSKNQNFAGNFQLDSGTTYTKGGYFSFDGTGTSTFTDNNSTKQNVGSVLVNGVGATLALGSGMKVDGLATSFNRTLNFGSGGYTLEWAGSSATAFPSINGPVDSGNSTVKFSGVNPSGNVALGLDMSYYSVEFSGAETYVPSGNLTVPGNLTVSSGATLNTVSGSNHSITVSGNITVNGTLTANASTITCAGSWNSSGGTFTYGTSTLVMTGIGKTFTWAGDWTVPRVYNITIDTGASVTMVRNGGAGVARFGNDIVLGANASFTMGNMCLMDSAAGDLTLGSGATLTIGSSLSRYVNNSSSHISTTGTITGAGYLEYVVLSGSTAAPITARAYGCDVVIAGISNSVGVLGGGTSMDLGSKNLRLYDSNENWSGDGGILDNPSNIPITTTGTLYLTWHSMPGKLIARGAVYQFGAIDMDEGTGAAGQIDCLTGGGASNWTVSGNVALDTGTTISAGASTWAVGGNWVTSGTFTKGTSTIAFNKSSGTQTINSGGTGTGKEFNNLAHSGAGTLSVITNDLEIDGTLDNTAGAIAETSAQINHPATSCLLTNSSGSEVSEFIIRTDNIYARVVDEDENLNGASADTLTGVTVTTTAGDSETLTLTETGNATEVFLSAVLPTTTGTVSAGNGTLELSASDTITATYIDNDDSTDTKTDTATCRAPAANFLLSASSPQTAGTDFTLTITARNADNTTATGYSGTVNLTSTYVSPASGTKTLSTTSTSTFTNGVAAVTERYDDAGAITITATDASDSTVYGTSSSITFVPDSFTVSASKASLYVNEPFTLTLTAKNSAGTTCANYKGLSTLSVNYVTPSTNQSGALSTSTLTGSAWSSGAYTLSNFTYNKFGIITIAAKDPDNTAKTGTSTQLTFLPKDLYVETASPSGGRDFYYQGEDIATTVTARDYNGATIANYASSVGFSGENLDLPGDYSFSSSDSGTHIFSDISATEKGATSLTATDASYSAVSGASSSFNVKKGKIVVTDTSRAVGMLPVSIKLSDSDGNDITNDSATTFTVALSESNSDDTATSPATSSDVTFSDGEAQIEVTDTQAEIVTVTPLPDADYLEVESGTVTFGGTAAPRFGPGARVLWWRELRSNER